MDIQPTREHSELSALKRETPPTETLEEQNSRSGAIHYLFHFSSFITHLHRVEHEPSRPTKYPTVG